MSIELFRKFGLHASADALERGPKWQCLLCKSIQRGRHGTLDDLVTPCPNDVTPTDGGQQ